MPEPTAGHHPTPPREAHQGAHHEEGPSPPLAWDDRAGQPADWEGRRVILAVTGGIACYKAAELVSRFVQRGVHVRVMMTEAATRFVAPLTFESLSMGPVVTSVWDTAGQSRVLHIELARWCELMVVAPATADTIAKLAAGVCDDVVSLVACALPQPTPVLLAPSMNADMWANPVVQRNVAALRQTLAYHTVGPEAGWQACRTTGRGRMSEPEAVIEAAGALLTPAGG